MNIIPWKGRRNLRCHWEESMRLVKKTGVGFLENGGNIAEVGHEV